MKAWILIMAAGFAFLACHLSSSPSPDHQPSLNAQAKPPPKPTPSPTSFADLKVLFFGDQSLEEVVKAVKPPSPGPLGEPWSLFASALAASRQGKSAEARRILKQVLTIPDVESRVRLWAWRALREVGEAPPTSVADEIQGVVCELHNEAGVGTIAAYADGCARWLGGQGKVIVWEAPGSDAEMTTLIQDLLKSAQPLVKTAEVSDRHKTPEPKLNYFRVSILTYGGVRTVEAFGPEIEQKAPIAPVLIASVNLLNALRKE